ncbi:hypothetical protein [Acetomicrobium sp.]|uniref:hypothetical protein n=1 Tax=Acetomicrobium sp. TaxID=1872099 RepID=UPI0028721B5C|nr:hypothetical protein [Acetomicrobium sp.]MDR9770471.1 hypothetical protein [Acetomicrobium sp.]
MTGDDEKQVLLKAYNAPLKQKSLFFPIIHYEAIPHENPKEARVPKLKTVKAFLNVVMILETVLFRLKSNLRDRQKKQKASL